MFDLKEVRIIDTKTGIYHNVKHVVECEGKLYANKYAFNQGLELDLDRNKILRSTGIKDVSQGREIYEGDNVDIKIIKADGKLTNVIYNVEVKYKHADKPPYLYVLKGNKELKLDDLYKYEFEVTYRGNNFIKPILL